MPEFVLKKNQILEKQQIDYDKLSLPDILELFPDLTSGQIRVDSKLHPFEHQMDVSGSPIAFRPRKLNPEKKQKLDTQLDEMLRLNIICTSTSPWASPVHLVKKKDDSYRLVLDCRAVNKRTKAMNYPLPRLQNFTANVYGSTVFTCLELKSAFWQLDVKASNKTFTAFCTHRAGAD